MQFQFPVQVYYEDTDAGGVVYYANYLKFMERARTEWLRELGYEQDELMESEGVLFAVRRAEVDYLRPARFNDKLLVTATLIDNGRASLTISQEVIRCADEQVLSRGVIKIACLSVGDLRPKPIPDQLLEKIKNAD